MSRETKADVAVYVYCLVRAPEEPPLAGAPPGIPGASEPSVLPLWDGAWAVAAEVPLAEYGTESLNEKLSDFSWVSDRALAHEAVVEHFGPAGTVLPLKLFTLYSSRRRALADLNGRRAEIEELFARLAGREEWGVRVLFDEARARRQAAESVDVGEAEGIGKSFLLRKKMEQASARSLAAEVAAEVESAFEDLAGRAAEARRREASGNGDAHLIYLRLSALLCAADRVFPPDPPDSPPEPPSASGGDAGE
jgi:hypothetical protein